MKHKKARKQLGSLWIALGLLLIAAALFLTAYNLYAEQRAEQASGQAIGQLEEVLTLPLDGSTEQDPVPEPEVPDYVLCPYMELPVEIINGIDYIGILRIPALDLELPIISRWSYPNLKTAPCRYSGSPYLNNLVLCGHNYKSHFGKLSRLQMGDTLSFTDMDGNEFSYEVVELETLRPTSVEEMEQGDWDLTLFTCTYGGKTRFTVRCERAVN